MMNLTRRRFNRTHQNKPSNKRESQEKIMAPYFDAKFIQKSSQDKLKVTILEFSSRTLKARKKMLKKCHHLENQTKINLESVEVTMEQIEEVKKVSILLLCRKIRKCKI